MFMFGMLFGSSVYAFVLRYHEHKSWLKGRSECDYCHHVLQPLDLIPIFSWLALGGKCRYCSKRLSWQYPLVELVAAILFALSYIFWPLSFNSLGVFQFICWLILITGFMILSIYDLKWYTLPDKIVFPLVSLSFLQLVVVSTGSGSVKYFLGGIIGAALISGIFYMLFQLSGGKWIGGGDVKLGICLGMIVGGPVNSVLLIFIASLIGTILAIPFALKNKTIKAHIPFGPLLMVATVIVFFFGSDLISWYTHLLT